MVSVIRSPWFISSTLRGSGLPEATGSNCSGLGGPCGRPDRVRYAKLTYSTPPRIWFAHVGFSSVPATGSSVRLSIVNAAHQWIASQLWLSNCCTQPGG